jgi:putative endonuclease
MAGSFQLFRHPEVPAEGGPRRMIGHCADISSVFIVSLMVAFVYMLRCRDDTYYVGSATGDDLTRRIAQHQSGAFPGYTYSRRPVELVWSGHFDRITDAIAVERQLKGWTRAKKEALIRGDWPGIRRLSQRRGGG